MSPQEKQKFLNNDYCGFTISFERKDYVIVESSYKKIGTKSNILLQLANVKDLIPYNGSMLIPKDSRVVKNIPLFSDKDYNHTLSSKKTYRVIRRIVIEDNKPMKESLELIPQIGGVSS